MQYGFLIDHTRCIGCHACTVACKSENAVPVSNFRTWVKYVEKGTFPAVRRHFAVLRCNHCSNAPCVTICPVNALEKRTDGIVDIHKDVCIGCRACMQACPYDAIYLNEDTGSVEKCHYCAHKKEVGLQPACVTVCPEEAIVHGDLHDPDSKIARMVREGSLVRRPEQKTGPNVHYRGVEPLLLEPGKAVEPPMYLWSDRPPYKPAEAPLATGEGRVVLNAGHRVEWGLGVAAYLVTKGIAAGAAMLAPFTTLAYVPELVALVFTGITTFLLVEDLQRPMKFLTLLTRPNTRSWLVKGAWILIAFSLTVTATIAAQYLGYGVDALRWVNAVLGVGVAGYTAMLFRQCEGRDLWQGPWVGPQLLAQATALGAAALMPFGAPLAPVLGVACLVSAAGVVLEWKGRHPTDNARQAAAFLGLLRVGPVPAMALVLAALGLAAVTGPIAPLFALLGISLYEWAFVRAGQLPSLS
jgi:Fe-S-cluster-containing dehydrogenase component/formate-dependent nitrite reductase membrane component NrfD